MASHRSCKAMEPRAHTPPSWILWTCYSSRGFSITAYRFREFDRHLTRRVESWAQNTSHGRPSSLTAGRYSFNFKNAQTRIVEARCLS